MTASNTCAGPAGRNPPPPSERDADFGLVSLAARLHRLLRLLLFFGLPWLLLVAGDRQRLDLAQRQCDDRRVERLEEAVGIIAARLSREPLLADLRRATWHLGPNRRQQQRLLARQQRMRRDFPGIVEFLVIGGDGRRVASLSDLAPTGELVDRLHRDLLAVAAPPAHRRHAIAAETHRRWIGPLFRPAPDIFNDLKPARTTLRRRFVFISHPHPKGILVAFVSCDRLGRERGLVRVVRRLRRSEPDLQMQLVDLRQVGESAASRQAAPRSRTGHARHPTHPATATARFAATGGRTTPRPADPDLGPVLARLGPSIGEVVVSGGTVFTQLTLDRHHRLVISLPNPLAARRRRHRGGWWAGSLALLLVIAWASLRRDFRRRTVSLRWQLVGLFGFATLVPLLMLLLALTGWSDEIGRRFRLARHQELEQRLLAFDASYGRWLGQLEGRWRAALRVRPGTDPDRAIAVALATLRDEQRQMPDALLGITDARGKSVDPYFCPDQHATLVRLITPLLLDRLARASGRYRGSLHADLLGATSEASGLDVDHYVRRYERSLGRIAEVRLHEIPTHIFLQPLVLADEPKYIAFFGFSYGLLTRRFIAETESERVKRFGPAGFFLATPRSPFGPGLRAPGLDRWGRRLQPLLARRGLPVHRYLPGTRRGVLITGIAGRHLAPAQLYAWTDDAELRQQLARWRTRAIAVIGLILLGGLAAGRWLARQVLWPIGVLHGGLRAFTARQFSTRLPRLAPDEFGVLIDAFNEMLAGLADLEVGRTLAEHLYPREPLRTPAWAVAGSCRSASRMGGDWFDFRPADGEAALVAIGDVTGHGTGPALVVAMATALMTLIGTGSSPAETIVAFNRGLYPVLARKRFMTLSVTRLDPRGHRLTLANAGQCHPLRVRGGAAAWLEATGFPIGALPRLSPREVTFELEPGDTVVFFTDGLVEARAADGGLVGFARLQAALPALIRPDPAATVETIRQWHQSITDGRPADDDVTVVVWQDFRSANGGALSGPPSVAAGNDREAGSVAAGMR